MTDAQTLIDAKPKWLWAWVVTRHPKAVFWNVYSSPHVNGKFFGKQHETRESADVAAEHESAMEKETERVAVLHERPFAAQLATIAPVISFTDYWLMAATLEALAGQLTDAGRWEWSPHLPTGDATVDANQVGTWMDRRHPDTMRIAQQIRLARLNPPMAATMAQRTLRFMKTHAG